MPRCVHLASDLHLGAPDSTLSRERERAFVRWMRDATEGRGFAEGKPATELHLVGDIFDFWHEYHHVVPKGGARVMGSAQALPERIDKDTAERVAGRHFCSTDFDALATQTPGFISREQLLEAARVRNLSFTLREKSQKKFDFGFVAEEKEDA